MQLGNDVLLIEVLAVSIKPSELVRQVLQSGRDEIAQHNKLNLCARLFTACAELTSLLLKD